jgi:putative addiction module CopG family antidote
MNTTLPPKVEELIKERLQRGPYKTAAEVIEDAFEALTEREKLDELRRDLQEAMTNLQEVNTPSTTRTFMEWNALPKSAQKQAMTRLRVTTHAKRDLDQIWLYTLPAIMSKRRRT